MVYGQDPEALFGDFFAPVVTATETALPHGRIVESVDDLPNRLLVLDRRDLD